MLRVPSSKDKPPFVSASANKRYACGLGMQAVCARRPIGPKRTVVSVCSLLRMTGR